MAAMREPQFAEEGARLSKLRGISDWSGEVFAHKIGYVSEKPSSHISRFESGFRLMPKEKRIAAAKAFASSPFLVDDWEYILGYLEIEHSDLRGCIAAVRHLSLVGEDEAQDSINRETPDEGSTVNSTQAKAA